MKIQSRRYNAFLYKTAALALCAALAVPAYAADPLPAAARSVPEIPSHLGTLDEFVRGGLDTTVYYIQDAHSSLEAQKNIAALIETIHPDTVFEEGYEGPVPTDAFFGPLKAAQRQEVSSFLLDRLRIGGAEYAHIRRTREFALIGADNLRLHGENIRRYREAVEAGPEVAADLGRIEQEMKALAAGRFPKPFREWMKLKERYDGGSLDLAAYLERSRDLADGFSGRFKTIELILQDHPPPLALEALSARALFEEIDLMETAAAEKFLGSENDRIIFQTYKTARLLTRLSRLELSAAEFAAAKKRLAAFDAQQTARFIAAQTGRPVVLSANWQRLIRPATAFYETAHRRDEAVRASIQGYAASGGKTAVLVFGGFHKQRILEILRESGVSFGVVTPRITQLSPRHETYYKELMTHGRFDFEMADASASASTPERIFEMMKPGDFPVYLERVKASAAWREWAGLSGPRAELRSGEPGFGEFAVLAGGQETAERVIRLEEKTPLEFYFNIHTDLYLEQPETFIKARVWYQRSPNRWQTGPDFKIYDNFGNGVYRAGITLPPYLSGEVTFQYSADGGKTWHWANNGPADNYTIHRYKTAEIENSLFEIEQLRPEEIPDLAELDRRLPPSEERWPRSLFEHAAEDYETTVFAARKRGKIAAYILLISSDAGLTAAKYAVGRDMPRELLAGLWQSAASFVKGEDTPVLRADVSFDDVQHFGASLDQTVRKLPRSHERPEMYAITYRSEKIEGAPEEAEEIIPIELPPSGQALARAWIARRHPGTELEQTLAQLTRRFSSAPGLLLRRALGEKYLKPSGGFAPVVSFYVRDMSNKDIDAVMQIEEAEFEVPEKWSSYGFLKDDRTEEEKEAEGGGLLDGSEDESVRVRRVAIVDGKIVGYLVYKVLEERIDVQKLVVDPAYRFAGIGEDFVKEVKDVMKQKDLAFVAVQAAKDNLPVQRFLTKHGFVMLPEQDQSWDKIGRPEMIYWDPEIDAAMVRSKAQGVRFFRWVKHAKAEMQKTAREKLEKSPAGVAARLEKNPVSPYKKNAKGSVSPTRLHIKEAGPGHAAELARFARESSRYRWTEKDFIDFLERGGRILIARSYGYINGFLAIEPQGRGYRVHDAAFAVSVKFSALFNRFAEKLARTDEKAERFLWEIGEKDFDELEGKNTLVKGAKFQALEIYEAKQGEESVSAYMLQRQIHELPEGVRLLRQWAVGLERTPVSYAAAVAQAEEFGLDLSLVYDELGSRGVKVLPPATGKESLVEAKRAPKPVHIRWMIRRDMPEVLAIEEASYTAPWTAEDFIQALRQRNTIGMVAEHDEQIIGFMVYELYKGSIRVINLAVDPRERFQAVGHKMIERLKDKLSMQRRSTLFFEVRESSLAAQIFLQKQGFRVIRIERGFFDDTGEDAYVFAYHLEEAESSPEQTYKVVKAAAAPYYGEELEDSDYDSTPLGGVKEAFVSSKTMLRVWAKRQPLEALTTSAVQERYPELSGEEADSLLNPIRREKFAQRLYAYIAENGNVETGRTLEQFVRISSLTPAETARILSELGLKVQFQETAPLKVTIENSNSHHFHSFEEMEPPEFLTKAGRWTYSDFAEAFEQGYRAYTVRAGSRIAGYILYKKTAGQIQVLKLRVLPLLRFRGIEKQLLTFLKKDPGNKSYRTIHFSIDERDLYNQVLLRGEKFASSPILPGDETADRLINFTYTRPVLNDATKKLLVKSYDRVFIRHAEGAIAVHLSGADKKRILRTTIEKLDRFLKAWFGVNALVNPGQETLSWKAPEGAWVTRSLRSPVEIREIQAFLQGGLDRLKNGAQDGAEKPVEEENRPRNELRLADNRDIASKIKSFHGRYAVALDLAVFSALSPQQRAEYYKLFEAYANTDTVKFVFGAGSSEPLDDVLTELLAFRRQYSNVEIRTNLSSDLDLRGRKILSITKEGVEDLLAKRIKTDERLYRVRYKKAKEPGLLTAALLLLEAGQEQLFTAEGFSDIPPDFAAEIQSFLRAYIYAASSA